MRQPSLKRTLLFRCGVGVSLLLCLLSWGVYLLVKKSLYREVDESIAQTAALLANEIELEDGKISFEWREGMGTNKSLIEDGFFQFWDETTGITTRSPGLRQLNLPRFTGPGGEPRLKSIQLPNGHRAHAIGLRIFPFVLPEEIERMKGRGHVIDPKSLPHILVVARDSEPVHHTLARLRGILAGGSLLTLALGLLLIDRVVRITLRPIDNLTAQMRNRSGHQLDSALDVPGLLPIELAGLAENFDSLLARVAAIRQRETDFIRHAVHELRTPIAGLRATTDLALSQPREAGAYAAHLATCQKTAIELGELVKRLSALSRIGQENSPPSRDPLDTTALLTDCISPFLSLLQERGITVNRNFPGASLIASGDTTLLRIIFNNLFDNIVSYACADSEVSINGSVAGGEVEIRISNMADDLPDNPERLFEPLFRREASRNDSGTHLGIGLTLSLEAATAMGASLQARKPEDGWIEFTLKIPLPEKP
ncbi:MAG: ATP-binding protein [Luteolibacter sp.]|uniref:ATP-binding protein n=1 Tax=Luteolibacter sp. TaxID=1962973 RepID=UPI003263D706